MPGILVVEDDENLNRGITFSLKKSGYEVFSAESVKKAKRIASDNNVDVTICDVNLPDGNGLEFVRWMRCNYNTYTLLSLAILFAFFTDSAEKTSYPNFFSENVIPRFKFSSSSTTSIPGIAYAPLFINYFSSSLHICSASISSVVTFPVISL